MNTLLVVTGILVGALIGYKVGYTIARRIGFQVFDAVIDDMEASFGKEQVKEVLRAKLDE